MRPMKVQSHSSVGAVQRAHHWDRSCIEIDLTTHMMHWFITHPSFHHHPLHKTTYFQQQKTKRKPIVWPKRFPIRIRDYAHMPPWKWIKLVGFLSVFNYWLALIYLVAVGLNFGRFLLGRWVAHSTRNWVVHLQMIFIFVNSSHLCFNQTLIVCQSKQEWFVLLPRPNLPALKTFFVCLQKLFSIELLLE